MMVMLLTEKRWNLATADQELEPDCGIRLGTL